MNGDGDDVKPTVDRQSGDWLAGPVNGCWNGAYNSVFQGVVLAFEMMSDSGAPIERIELT